MRIKNLLPFYLLFFALASCQQSGDKSFKDMTQEEDFKDAHPKPKPYTGPEVKGENVTFPAGDKEAKGYLVKAEKPTNKYLLLFHEWWGLNDYIRKEAGQYAGELDSVNVLALDLYDGKVATKPEEAQKLVDQVEDDRIREIIKGAFAYTGDTAELATLGWCFGGGWSLQATIMAGDKADACVMYYGMPEESTAELKKLRAPVLGIFGTKDEWITPKVVRTFESRMRTLGKPVRIQSYDAVHAFANPSNPDHNPKATADARKLTLGFLRDQFVNK